MTPSYASPQEAVSDHEEEGEEADESDGEEEGMESPQDNNDDLDDSQSPRDEHPSMTSPRPTSEPLFPTHSPVPVSPIEILDTPIKEEPNNTQSESGTDGVAPVTNGDEGTEETSLVVATTESTKDKGWISNPSSGLLPEWKKQKLEELQKKLNSANKGNDCCDFCPLLVHFANSSPL